MIKPDLLFVYGILKRGFPLDMEKLGSGEFIAQASIPNATLYRIGSGVGLRFNPHPLLKVEDGPVIYGELFKITDSKVWDWLDSIENNGLTYTRKVTNVLMKIPDSATVTPAWVYEHTVRGMVYKNAIEGGNF